MSVLNKAHIISFTLLRTVMSSVPGFGLRVFFYLLFSVIILLLRHA